LSPQYWQPFEREETALVLSPQLFCAFSGAWFWLKMNDKINQVIARIFNIKIPLQLNLGDSNPQ